MSRQSVDRGDRWGVYNSTVNLPAALNDPGKGTKVQKYSTFVTKVAIEDRVGSYCLRAQDSLVHF